MPRGFHWEPIRDLEGTGANLTDGELVALKRVWEDQKKELIANGVLEEFEKRLRREWSIETGIIENVYTLDRGVTKSLIDMGIDAALIPHGATNRDNTLVARIIQDHYDALESLFDFIKGDRELSTSYIKELRAALLRNQDSYTVVDQFGKTFEKRLERGQYKTAPNSPARPDGTVHEYCPPEHVASEMDRLIEMHASIRARGAPVEVEAAWFHHRFAQIHPFADGNGRVARALATLVFIKAGWFPVIVKREDWSRYIEALEIADRGDLRPLVQIFVEGQRTALLQAAEAVYSKSMASTNDAIAAVKNRLIQRGKLPLKEWTAAQETANRLAEFASQRFSHVAARLGEEIQAFGRIYLFRATGPHVGATTAEIQAAIKNADIATAPDYSSSVTLELDSGRAERLTLYFYAIGPRFRGIIGIVAYLSIQGTEPHLLDDGMFQINYEEDAEKAQARFSPWLERMIITGLNEWRKTL